MFPATDLNSLLRACKADPTDDEVRRILADFLEDQGQAERAEFVHLQLDTPDKAERREWSPLEARQEARQLRLIRKNAGAWLGGAWSGYGWVKVPTIEPNHFVSVSFERGLASLHMGEKPLLDLELMLPAGGNSWLEKADTGRILKPAAWAEICRSSRLESFSKLGIGWEDPDVGVLLALLDRVRPKGLSLSMDDPGPDLLPLLANAPWFRPHDLHLETFPGWDRFATSSALSAVRALDLRLRERGSLDALARAPSLASLRILYLTGDEMDAGSLTRLLHSQHLAGLRELTLSSYNGRGNRCIATALSGCRSLSGLRDLGLFLSGLDDESNAALLATSPALAGLRNFRLHSCELTPAGATALFSSPHLCNLECVNLSCNPIGDAGVTTLATAPALEKLRQLDLCKTGITNAGLRALVGSPRFAQLEMLVLSLNQLDEAGFKCLAGANGGRLRKLDVGTARPGRAGWQALTRSGLLNRVVHLDVETLGLGAEEAADLAGVPLPELSALEMGYNPLGPAGAQSLAAAPWLDQLYVLHLSEAQIGDDGLIALLSGLRSGTLAELWLQKNDIGERGARALLAWSGLPHLVNLGIDNNSIGKDLKQQIHEVVRAGVMS
jgi:uncharacterized protein (TIGR02996 family)